MRFCQRLVAPNGFEGASVDNAGGVLGSSFALIIMSSHKLADKDDDDTAFGGATLNEATIVELHIAAATARTAGFFMVDSMTSW